MNRIGNGIACLLRRIVFRNDEVMAADEEISLVKGVLLS